MEKDPLEQAHELAQAGDQPGARKLLMEILRVEPCNAYAWEALAGLLDDPEQRADCYRRVLQIDPGNQSVSFKLAELTDKPVHLPPPEVRDVVKLLHEVGLAALDRATLERLKTLGVTVTVGEDGYVSVEAQGRAVKVHTSSMPNNLGNMTPEEIIDRAGAPLSPAERRKCPRCDAVIPGDATRCEWCSLKFTPDGEPVWD